MQYPIIDNLIYAYLANNWTGLGNVNAINMWNEVWYKGVIETTGSLNPTVNRVTTDYIPVNEHVMYAFHMPISARGRGAFYDRNYNLISYYGDYPLNLNDVIQTTDGYYFIITPPENSAFFRYTLNTTYGSVYNYDVSLNFPSSYHNYISLEESDLNIKRFNDDIAHRLRLPLVRNFPHPVIDALISAADGQQTEEENEILRHYLTQLGIGGI